MEFSVEQRQKCHELLCGLYDLDSLKSTLYLRMGVQLGHVVDINKAFPHVVTGLLEYAEAAGELEMLLRTVLETRPKREDFRIFCQENFPQILEPTTRAGLVGKLTVGVISLVEQLGDPVVRQKIGEFQAFFRTIQRQIQVLTNYKRLHDILHLLQWRLPNLQSDVTRFPDDLSAVTSLSPARLALSSQVDRARESLGSLPTEGIEESWVDDFADSVDRQETAWQERDPDLMNSVLLELRYLIRELPRIDGLLAFAVSELPLSALVTALKAIFDHLRNSDSAEKSSFIVLQEAVRSLGLLRPELLAMVNEHNEWQWLDKELAGIDVHPGPRPTDKVPRWRRVKERLQSLCRAYQDETNWTGEILEHAESWEQHAASLPSAITAGDSPGGLSTLATSTRLQTDLVDLCLITADSLRAYTIKRFMDVDRSLLELCEELVQIGSSIDTLLEAFTSHD